MPLGRKTLPNKFAKDSGELILFGNLKLSPLEALIRIQNHMQLPK